MPDRTQAQTRLIRDRRRADEDWEGAKEALSERVEAADPDLWRIVEELTAAGDWRVSIAEKVDRVLGLEPDEEPPEPPDALSLVLVGVAPEERATLIEDVLGPILGQSHRKATDLLDTLDALYRHGGRTVEAGAELYIHEKTVRYRVRVVEKLTGLNLKDPADRLRLDLALLLRRVVAAE